MLEAAIAFLYHVLGSIVSKMHATHKKDMKLVFPEILKHIFLLLLTVRPRFTQPAKMRKRVIARPVGSSVRLKCTASGNPRPDIVWLKDSRPLTPEEVGESRKKKWTLSLKNLTPEHSGKYTCHVSNRAGEINATYKVEVIRKSSDSPLCAHL